MLKILIELKIVKLFILAIILRLLIMPFYFHPDIKTYNYQASFLKNGIFNVYSYLTNNKDKLPIKEDFVYFPLAYLFLGTYQIIATPILGPNFNIWLSDASSQSVERIGVFRYLFILKFPYLLLDLLVPFLIIYFLKDIKQKKEIFVLWLFNPISIAIIYIFSNIDIIPVVLSLMSLLLFKNKKILLSGLILGIAAGFKAYPLLFLPFFLLYTNKYTDLLRLLTVSLGSTILIIAPFWSTAFLNSALISGLTTRIAFPGIGLGFGESLMVAVLLPSSLFMMGLTENKKKLDNIWLLIFLVLLFLFSSIHFHIQWLLWIMPFLVLFYTLNKKIGKFGFVWLTLAFLIPLLYDDKSMSVSLLSVVNPLYNLLPTTFLILQRIYDPFIIQGIIHSIMLAISLVIFFRSYRLLKHD